MQQPRSPTPPDAAPAPTAPAAGPSDDAALGRSTDAAAGPSLSSDPLEPSSRRVQLALWLALLVGMLLLAPVLRYPYVWDDLPLLSANPYLGQLAGLPTALLDDFWRYTAHQRHSGYYRPIVTLSYWLEALVGPRAWFSHLINVVLHLANGLLAGLLLASLARTFTQRARDAGVPSPPASESTQLQWIGAPLLLFLVAPVNLEAVVWVSGRPELLAATGVLSAMVLEPHARRHGGARALQALAFFVGLCAKEVAIVTPALLWITGLAVMPAPLPRSEKAPSSTVWGRIVPLSLALSAYLGLRLLSIGSHVGDKQLSSQDLVATLGVLGLYLGRLILPVGISADTQTPPPGPAMHGAAVLGLLFVVGLLALSLRVLLAARRQKAASITAAFLPTLCLGLWCVGLPLLPAAYAVVGQSIPDRYLYLPSVGLAVLALLLLTRPPRRAPSLRFLPALAALLFLGASALHLPVWSSETALWQDAVLKDPEHVPGRASLARALADTDRLKEAELQYRILWEQTRATPRWLGYSASAALSLGSLAQARGERSEARQWFQEGLRRGAFNAAFCEQVGLALKGLGDLSGAREAFSRALELEPVRTRAKAELELLKSAHEQRPPVEPTRAD